MLAVAATGMVPLVVKRATDALKPLSIPTGRHRQLQGVSFGVVLVGILGKKPIVSMVPNVGHVASKLRCLNLRICPTKNGRCQESVWYSQCRPVEEASASLSEMPDLKPRPLENYEPGDCDASEIQIFIPSSSSSSQ